MRLLHSGDDIESIRSLDRDPPQPTQDEIIAAMDDNLCRCGSHMRIVQAIQTAAKVLQKGDLR